MKPAYRYRLATEDDNEKILDLISKTPQQGLVTLNFERSPNFFFGTQIATEISKVVVAENTKSGEIDGMTSFGFRRVYVNGEVRQLGYANDLRICEEHRGGRLLLKLYRKTSEFLEDGDFAQTVILEENQKSLTTIAAGRAGMPTYYDYGKLITYIISTSYDLTGSATCKVRPATKDDIPELQEFLNREAPNHQFFPAYDLEQLDCSPYYRNLSISDYFLAIEDGEILGVCGIWKQKPFKQTKIVNYPAWMTIIRPIYNVFCNLFGGFPLPKKGHNADYTSLHTVLVKNNSTDVLHSLIKNIRSVLACRGEKTMIIALAEGHPLQPAIRGFIHRKLRSLHFLGTYGPDCRGTLNTKLPLYLEVSRL